MYRRNAAIRLSVNFPRMSLRRCHINMENHRGCRAWAMCLRLMRFVWSRKDRSQGFSPSGQEAERRGRCRLEWLGSDCMACVTESRKGRGGGVGWGWAGQKVCRVGENVGVAGWRTGPPSQIWWQALKEEPSSATLKTWHLEPE